MHLKNLSACFYGGWIVEGKERDGKASLAALSAVQDSKDGDLTWEVTAGVADGEGLEQYCGGRHRRTIGYGLRPGGGEWAEVRRKDQCDAQVILPLSSVSSSQEK